MRKPYICCDTCVYGYGVDVDDQPCCSCVDGENYEKAHDAEDENGQDQLKPCPFCGGKATLIRTHCMSNGFTGYHVFHYELKCGMKEIRTHTMETPQEAIAAWNGRFESGK